MHRTFEISRSYGRRLFFVLFRPLFRGITYFMEDKERKERHPLFLILAESLI